MADKQYRIHIKHGDFELDLEGDRAFVESYVEALLADTVGQDMAAAPAASKPKAPRTSKRSAGPKPKAGARPSRWTRPSSRPS